MIKKIFNKTMCLSMLLITPALHASAPLEGAHCGTETAMQQLFNTHPASLKEHQTFNAKSFSRPQLLNSRSTQVDQNLAAVPSYIIPVVFHVYGTSFNGKSVNDAIIIDALQKTNEDFQGLTADYGSIISEFENIKDFMNIEFRLAKIDPNGNATTGIVYHQAQSGFGNGSGYDSLIQADAWDNFKYMNVYIQNDLYADGGTTNSGVAWYPDTYMSNNNLARVVYNGAYLGTNTSENFRSVLTHEFGHWLNLIHTFQGGCNSTNQNYCSSTGDQICDTPQVDNSGLQARNCLGQMTNWQNFMHYSDQYANFTQQQVDRMVNATNHTSRSSLWTEANLIATGTANPDGGNVPPTAKANGPYSGEAGSAISFSSAGSSDSDGSIASYSWNFGDNTSSTSANPNHTYNSSGNYTVTLTVTDNQGATNSSTTTATISAAGGNELQNGVAKTGLSATTGQSVNYYIDVPSGATNLSIQISGGSGDADLYTQVNATPTDSSYTCRPYKSGNAETCNVATPSAGRWYARVKAYNTFSGVTLLASYQTGNNNQAPVANINGPYTGTANSSMSFSSAGSNDPDGTIASYAWNFGDGGTSANANPTYSYANAGTFNVSLTVTDDQGATHSASTTATVTGGSTGTQLSNGQSKSISGTQASEKFYTMAVPANATNLSFKLNGGTGDADIYVKFGSAPSQSDYDCRPYVSGNNETCNISNVQAGTYHVMVRGYSAYSTNLTGSYTEGNTNPGGNVPNACATQSPQTSGSLTNGTVTCLGSSSTMWFSIPDVSGHSSIAISSGNGTGNLNLEFSNSGWPNGSNVTGSSSNSGNAECIYLTNQSQYWGYLKVTGASSGASIVVDFDTAGCRN